MLICFKCISNEILTSKRKRVAWTNKSCTLCLITCIPPVHVLHSLKKQPEGRKTLRKVHTVQIGNGPMICVLRKFIDDRPCVKTLTTCVSDDRVSDLQGIAFIFLVLSSNWVIRMRWKTPRTDPLARCNRLSWWGHIHDCRQIIKYIQGSAKERFLGCVILASWPRVSVSRNLGTVL